MRAGIPLVALLQRLRGVAIAEPLALVRGSGLDLSELALEVPAPLFSGARPLEHANELALEQEDLVAQAAKKYGYQQYFFKQEMDVEDDHLAFVERGVPSIDIIDLDYGPNNSYHHTTQDTMDKISAHSLTIDGDVFMETIRLIDQR